MRHGTRNGYQYHGCRCDACVQAHRDHQRADYRKRKGMTPPKHGTAYIYERYGCRCDACCEAGRAKRKRSERGR